MELGHGTILLNIRNPRQPISFVKTLFIRVPSCSVRSRRKAFKSARAWNAADAPFPIACPRTRHNRKSRRKWICTAVDPFVRTIFA